MRGRVLEFGDSGPGQVCPPPCPARPPLTGRPPLSSLAVGSARAVGLLLAALLAALLTGCGGSSSPDTTTSAVPNSPAAATQGSAPATTADAVASVSGTPIAKSSYEHWLAVEKALGSSANAGHQVLGFLITSDWVLDEAAARGIKVSEAEVEQRLAQIEQKSFPKAGALQKFLARSGESQADLLARVKVELLESKIAAQVAAGKSGAQRSAVLASFQSAFHKHWKAYTTCKAPYLMEDCAQYTGKPENLTTASASSGSPSAGSTSGTSTSVTPTSGTLASGTQASGTPASGTQASGTSASGAQATHTSTSGTPASAASNASGELPPSRPGALTISSPAFAANGALPSTYTCDGANISPPLQWQNVPAKAAALVLFVIDDTSTGPASGIRWVVGDIDPSSSGVAAGKTPAGGIVGSDSQGHAGYGGICPAPGQTGTIEFEMYALSKKIPLSPGFQPAVAEQEYGAGKLVLGEAAVTYATYRRAG